MKVALKLFIIIIFSFNLSAIEIDENSSGIDILSQSYIFIDKTNSITKINLKDEEFIKNHENVLGFGIQPSTAVWLRFTLKNNSDKELHKILEYGNPETEDLNFYFDDKKVQDGMFHHSESRTTINPILNINLKPFEEKIFYIKAHCKISTLIVKLTLWENIDFIHHQYKHKIYLFIFFTIIATLLLYNLMLFIFTKDVVYFYYILYLSAVIFFQSVYLGIAQLYFFSNEVSIFVTKGTIGYISMLIVPMILFSMEFLHTKQFKKTHTFLKLYLYMLPYIVLLSFDNLLFDLNIMLIYFPLSFVLIYTSFRALNAGIKEAIFYIIAWSFVIITLVFSVLQSLGVYDVFVYFAYINELAFALEALLFSIALAHRIKSLSEEKMLSDKKLIEFQQEEQELLESLVDEKIKDLKGALDEKEILYKELNHRVKNNIQMILSLIKLQIGKTNSQLTRDELVVTKNRINSISKLYEILHLKDATKNIDTKIYFQNIVNNIKENFSKDISIKYDITHHIQINDLMYCGLILNELVTNSFKYAFNENGNIYITIHKIDNNVYMTVRDNGIGFSKENVNSLGLTIVETLAQKQLHGNVHTGFIKGTKTIIIWSENEK